MSDQSGIEWTDTTWNPVTGCAKISPGCINCYAERMAKRLRGRHGYPADEPFRVTLHPERLGQPLRWKKPRHVFVDSMGDLFHEDVPDEFVCMVFHIMRRASQHTFQVLTKRPERMDRPRFAWAQRGKQFWPQNVWAGVSVELQKYAHRIDTLLQVPAAERLASFEPLLGPMELDVDWLVAPCPGCGRHEPYCDCELRGEWPDHPTLNWVIVGCESKGGHLGRLSVDGKATEDEWWGWVRDIKNQCVAAGVPFFFKQAPFEGRLIKEPALAGRTWLQKPGETQAAQAEGGGDG